MAQIISHPFRLAGGRVAVVDQFSDQANAEQIAVLVLTKLGERVLVPQFGIEDPTFIGLDPGDVSVGLGTFGPEVDLIGVDAAFSGPTTQEVTITYE